MNDTGDWPHSLMRLVCMGNSGLQLLLQARIFARELGCDSWQFAVEIEELQRHGMTVNELRWLLATKNAEHALEVSPGGEHREGLSRQFDDTVGASFSPRSCFILTDQGTSLMGEMLTGESLAVNNLAKNGASASAEKPVWDAERHVLTLKHRIVKRFRQHSPNQEAVLTAFQEENWPCAIYDPLPPFPHQDPKQRMRDTIKNLNRHQVEPLIHFSGDGSGERILWEPNE